MSTSFLAAMLRRENDTFVMAGDKALLHAANQGDATSMQGLLQKGELKCSQSGHEALLLACSHGHVDCAHSLLVAGVDILGSAGTISMFAAARGGHASCLAMLLECGAPINDICPGSSHTPLQVASALGHGDCVALLLAYGAAPNASDEHGVTSLHSAAWQDHAQVVQLLVARRCAIDAVDASGATALHLAAKFGCIASCERLLDAAKDERGERWSQPCPALTRALSAEDNLGATPLQYALERGHQSAAWLIARAMAQQLELLDTETSAGSDGGNVTVEEDTRAAEVAKDVRELRAAMQGLDSIAKSELRGICCSSDDLGTKVENGSYLAVERLFHLDTATRYDASRHASERSELPEAFAEQAMAMPLYLRRLLVENEPPSSTCVGSLIRALRLPPAELSTVCMSLGLPARKLLMRSPGCLKPESCAALRAAVDRVASQATKADSVDGLAEHQLDLTAVSLAELAGEETVEGLRLLPRQFYESSDADSRGTGKGDADRSMPNPSRLVIKRAFVRRYTACERPWFTLHMDTAALTANVALASDALHEGGRLLALAGGEGLLAIERAEGEATVHPSSLLHGVTRMRGDGMRYSLIVFYRTRDEC